MADEPLTVYVEFVTEAHSDILGASLKADDDVNTWMKTS